ncbi:MAG: alpha/beta hydrolase [Rhodospirillales bacterium]|nr:alpha/beta hydrolase [Rhodospirillales bacterium]
MAEAAYRERWYTSQDGLRLFFRDYPGPDGENASMRTAVLCLPGVTRNSKDFGQLAKRLSRRYRVLCPDFRGRGLSAYDPNPDNYTPATYVNDIRHLLAASGVHHVHVIGTSLGGFVAMVMAVAMPTTLASVVLNDIGPEIGQTSLGGIIEYMLDDTPLPDWDAATEHVRRAFLPNLPNGSDEDWLQIARNTYKENADGKFIHAFDIAIVKQFKEALGHKQDLWPLFRALRPVRVLTLRGALSGILSAETLDRMSAVMPAMAHFTVEDRGHPPLLSEPSVLEVIDAHLF